MHFSINIHELIAIVIMIRSIVFLPCQNYVYVQFQSFKAFNQIDFRSRYFALLWAFSHAKNDIKSLVQVEHRLI